MILFFFPIPTLNISFCFFFFLTVSLIDFLTFSRSLLSFLGAALIPTMLLSASKLFARFGDIEFEHATQLQTEISLNSTTYECISPSTTVVWKVITLKAKPNLIKPPSGWQNSGSRFALSTFYRISF